MPFLPASSLGAISGLQHFTFAEWVPYHASCLSLVTGASLDSCKLCMLISQTASPCPPHPVCFPRSPFSLPHSITDTQPNLGQFPWKPVPQPLLHPSTLALCMSLPLFQCHSLIVDDRNEDIIPFHHPNPPPPLPSVPLPLRLCPVTFYWVLLVPFKVKTQNNEHWWTRTNSCKGNLDTVWAAFGHHLLPWVPVMALLVLQTAYRGQSSQATGLIDSCMEMWSPTSEVIGASDGSQWRRNTKVPPRSQAHSSSNHKAGQNINTHRHVLCYLFWVHHWAACTGTLNI